MTLDKDDSLKVVTMGYENKVVRVKEIISDSINFKITLQSKSYLLKGVDIEKEPYDYLTSDKEKWKNLHLPENIKIGKPLTKEMDYSNGYKEEPPPVVVAVMNPITYMEYYNKKNKSKRMVHQLKADAYERDRTSLIYNTGLLAKISGYEQPTLDSFIVYCNIQLKIKSSASYISICKKVEEAKEAFELERY